MFSLSLAVAIFASLALGASAVVPVGGSGRLPVGPGDAARYQARADRMVGLGGGAL